MNESKNNGTNVIQHSKTLSGIYLWESGSNGFMYEYEDREFEREWLGVCGELGE
jgi:hypothetical protein